MINLSFSEGLQALPKALFLLKSGYQNIGWVQCLEGNFLLSHSHKIIVCAIQVLIRATSCSFNCLSFGAIGGKGTISHCHAKQTLYAIKKMPHSLSCQCQSPTKYLDLFGMHAFVCVHVCAWCQLQKTLSDCLLIY